MSADNSAQFIQEVDASGQPIALPNGHPLTIPIIYGWRHHYRKAEKLLERGGEANVRAAHVHAVLATVGVGRGDLAEATYREAYEV